MKNHRRLSNAEFLEALNELITTADGNEAVYGWTTELLDEAKATRSNLSADEADKILKRAASKAATTKAKTSRKKADDLVSLLKLTSKSNQVSADKLNEVGFDADDEIKSLIEVFAPTNVSAEGFSNGKNTVKFDGNGNKPGTIYIVEAKTGDAPDYVIVGFTKKKVFDHHGQKPGVKVLYRVRAQRGDDFSEYSNEAVVYDS